MFEELKAILSECFDKITIPFYLLGIIVYFITIIDDLKCKEKKGFLYYLQDFLYSMIAVTIGISVGHLMGLPKAAYWIITIGCAFIGATLFRKLDSTKETISDKAVNKITDACIKKVEEKLSNKSDESNKEKEDSYNDI